VRPRMRIAVAGATGRVGHHVADVLAAGHDIVAMSRSSGVDVVTGEGLGEALTRVECVIDTACGPSPKREAATERFIAAARNLHAAGERAGVRRMVVMSILGVDAATTGYGAAKLAHERAMLAGPIPVRVLRVALLHEFVGELLEWGRQGDVCYLPKVCHHPVAARAVALALAGLATDPAALPASGSAGAPIAEIAGPQREALLDLGTRLAARRGDPVRVEGVREQATPARDLWETNAMLPGPDATLAGPTFQEWLDAMFWQGGAGRLGA
jgi:uncharacterized protein YbjT (DUF2867 family)